MLGEMIEGSRSRLPIIAMAAAAVALATSVVAVVVMLARGSEAPADARIAGSATTTGDATSTASVVEVDVSAADVLKLKQRELVEDAADGVQVSDATLRTALKLQPDDVIAAVGGRVVKREFDLYDAMMGLTMAETTTVYVDLVRDGAPVLARWKLDVSMRAAWRTSRSSPSTGSTNPFLSPRADPTIDADPALVQAIVKVDDTSFEAPRGALDAVFGFTVRGVRTVPAIKNGAPAGVKLYAIRPTSIYAALGFANGDTIRALNGTDTPSIDKVIEAYTTQKAASRWTVEIERRGRPETISIVVK